MRLWLGAYAALVLLVIAFLANLNWNRYRRLMTTGVVTQAKVVQKTCASHHTFKFEFTVGGRTFRSTGQDGAGNPACDMLNVGDLVSITYHATDPAINVAGSAAARLGNETISVASAALLGPTFLLGIAYQLSERRRQSAVG